MLQSESGIDEISEDGSCFFDFEEDEIFEQNIDDFDEAMDRNYDDGIADSELEDSYDEDLDDQIEQSDSDEEEKPIREDALDELDDYDELEE